MANWSNPLLTSTYTDFLTEVKDRDTDLALQFDGTTSTNIPTNTIRWNSSINRWQKWSGSAWGELTTTYALTALTTTTTVTAAGNVSGAALVPSSATIPVAGIFLPAANTLAFATATTERLRIDSSGRLLVGTSSSITAVTFPAQVQTNSFYSYSASLFSADATGSNFLFLKSRNATTGSHTVVQANDVLGQTQYAGSDGTAFITGAAISAVVDGTPGLNDMPGRLVFSTTADGASSPTERMRIDSSGRVGIGTSSPGAILHTTVTSAGAATIGAFLQNSSLTAGTEVRLAFAPNINSVSDNRYSWIGALNVAGSNDSALTFATAPGGAPGTERMRIDSAGNVGIGGTPGSYKLDVQGGVQRILNQGSTSALEIGAGTATNQTAHIDLTTDTTYTDFGLRLIRDGAGGANGVSQLAQKGTGELSLRCIEAAPLTFYTTNTERARIDSSGRLLVGTSASTALLGYNSGAQFAAGTGTVSFIRNTTDNGATEIVGAKSRGTSGTPVIVSSGDGLCLNRYAGYDGAAYIEAARISAVVDGTPALNSMPGRLIFSTTADGASSPTERLRITNDGVQAYNQPAPAAVNATATLTVANLKAGIITSTSAAATDMTLPTGTDTQAGFSGTYDNMTFEWSVINTGPSLVRVLAGTAHTVVGSGSVATGTSGRFASRRTAANTFVTYRLT